MKIIAYDLGTGGNKASLFDADGSCLAFTSVPYETFYPDTGWHEQRPEDWWKAVVASTRELLSKSPAAASDVGCLAISGQSLGVVPVDAAGTLLREKTPIWSDTRASRRGFRFRIPGWGSVPWKKVITELSLIGYDYVMSYEHEDVTMSRHDGITKTIAYLKPLLIEKPYEGRHDVLFQ